MRLGKSCLAILIAAIMTAGSSTAVFAQTSEEMQELKSNISQQQPETAPSDPTQVKEGTVTTAEQLEAAMKAGGTVVLGADIDWKTEKGSQILEVPAGVTVTLDLNGHTLTFDIWQFVNYGNLTINATGGGSIVAARGTLKNLGTAVINGGTYDTMAAADKGTNVYNAGQGVMTINNAVVKSPYYAVANESAEAKLIINGGDFTSTSCATCSSNWAYCVKNFDGYMEINGGNITGVQGALAVSKGYAKVTGGNFKTVACQEHGTAPAHYAAYIAGEYGTVEADILGGHFEAASKVAVMVGNWNDGGQKQPAAARISGGTFIGRNEKGELSTAINNAKNLGDPDITGGTYTSDVSEYISNSYDELKFSNTHYQVGKYGEDAAQSQGMVAKVTDENGVNLYYSDMSEAMDSYNQHHNLTILADTNENITVAEGDKLTIWKGATVTGNITNEGELTNYGTVNGDVANNGTIKNQDTGKFGKPVKNDGVIETPEGNPVAVTDDSTGEVIIVKKPSGGGGSVVLPPVEADSNWVKSPYGWWYRNPDGTYPASQWKYINTKNGYKWFWFNANGYMTTGWQKVGGYWYYMNGAGEMQTGWQFINNKWYYLNANGTMAEGWMQDPQTKEWYYMNPGQGDMHFGWLKWAGYWYHFDKHGVMSTGWTQVKGDWYYLYPANGRMAASTTTPDGYTVDQNGRWVK